MILQAPPTQELRVAFFTHKLFRLWSKIVLSLPVHLQPKVLPVVLATVVTFERLLFGVLPHVTLKLLDNSCCKVTDTTLETLLSLVAPLVDLQGVWVTEDLATFPALVEAITGVQLDDVLAQVILPAQDRGTVGALENFSINSVVCKVSASELLH